MQFPTRDISLEEGMVIIPEAIAEALWEEFKEETLPAILKSRLFKLAILIKLVIIGSALAIKFL